MNVDRYITDEAVQAATDAMHSGTSDRLVAIGLRAALPSVLAQHRLDVLREVLAWFDFESHTADILRDAINETEAEAQT